MRDVVQWHGIVMVRDQTGGMSQWILLCSSLKTYGSGQSYEIILRYQLGIWIENMVGTMSLCYHAHSSSMFLCATNHIPYVAISHYVHSCIFLHVVTHALHSFFIIKVTKKQKVYTAFLTACIRYHGNIYKQTMMPNALWIRKDGLSGILCQLIDTLVMHSITMP